MPIFTAQLGRIDPNNAPEALRKMYNHIRYIQEQLEMVLTSLDSSNITEIDADVTDITSSSGGMEFTGERLRLSGKNGESFEAGVGDTGAFQFKLTGKGGAQIFYLTSSGELIITDKASVSIDGGEW